MNIIAIDPGPTHSGVALVDTETYQPLSAQKLDNAELRKHLIWGDSFNPSPDWMVVEMISSYGMPVGREVFDTCVWIGRFIENAHEICDPKRDLIPRAQIKTHHCGTASAKDSNVIQALVDRFTPGEPNRGKGTKKAPGWFYGFKADVWQAYALAVYAADTHNLAIEQLKKEQES